ncbi:abscission/NoCut checkpoint regulator [Anopheles ziemanni]|uniref:abscission/NoCut checkpoint regulator n=1 Tax=Anopheles coustani TaxID=139045 RepID=UPI00265A2F45|nr:abscission/NoCut checkpoint regulator [Anopheles coustani]XP_058174159.1 abscission/NoCut checkpoint regulator [Anopheles ziemanni]
MACTICTKSFGFFNKEHGCPVCKFSFCSGCLKYKLVRDGKKLNVCLRCSKLSSIAVQPKRTNETKTPPSLVNDSSSAVTLLDEPIVSEVPRAITAEQPLQPQDDDEIRRRLDALKVKVPDETDPDAGGSSSREAGDNTDLEKRLAALKGVEYRDYKNAAQKFLAQDNRTEEEQVQDLIGRYADETKLDKELESKRMEQDDEIMRRLNALREFRTGGIADGATTSSGPSRPALPDSDSDDGLTDEELAKKLAQRYAEEGKLEAKLPPADSDEEVLSPVKTSPRPGNEGDEEELPWCTICNEDAVLRCLGCDNDLYCNSCFKEFHYDEDPREHKTLAFKQKVKKHK